MSSTFDATVVGCPGGAVPPSEAGVGTGFPSLDAIVYWIELALLSLALVSRHQTGAIL
jgi:hypothetical protein